MNVSSTPDTLNDGNLVAHRKPVAHGSAGWMLQEYLVRELERRIEGEKA